MHFRLERGTYRPYFASTQNNATAITDCPDCNASLNLMITHLENDSGTAILTPAGEKTAGEIC